MKRVVFTCVLVTATAGVLRSNLRMALRRRAGAAPAGIHCIDYIIDQAVLPPLPPGNGPGPGAVPVNASGPQLAANFALLSWPVFTARMPNSVITC
jgi:hypothetical protein